MKKVFFIILAIAIIFIPQLVLAKSEVDKARDLVTIGKNFEAQSILRSAIVKDPLNANLHYEAGILYLRIGDQREFDLGMENSCKLKSSNCSKVAEVYYALAFNALDGERNTSSAYRAFSKAFAYNPAKRSEALLRLYESGVDWLSRGDMRTADSHFSLLSSLDPAKKDSIAKVFFEKAMNASPEATIVLFEKAVSYSPVYKKQAGDILAEMAKNESYSQSTRDSLKSAAGKYLGRDEMLAHFPPDFREFKIGEVFEMQGMRAGDSNGFYIRQPMGKPSWRFVASYATGIKAVLRDGREFDIKHKSNLPDGDYDFKIVAYEDGARVKVWFENPR